MLVLQTFRAVTSLASAALPQTIQVDTLHRMACSLQPLNKWSTATREHSNIDTSTQRHVNTSTHRHIDTWPQGPKAPRPDSQTMQDINAKLGLFTLDAEFLKPGCGMFSSDLLSIFVYNAVVLGLAIVCRSVNCNAF